jgi:hypothetical protein
LVPEVALHYPSSPLVPSNLHTQVHTPSRYFKIKNRSGRPELQLPTALRIHHLRSADP